MARLTPILRRPRQAASSWRDCCCKTGAYGLIRFAVPLFPGAARAFAPVAMTLAVIGILYGAILAFAQTDLKRLVAYTSISHLGFVLLGIYAANTIALQGALMTMICHGISTGALFVVAGALQDRMHTREMGAMGGLWDTVPRLSGVALFFALASLGLPGLGDFIGEFLVLLGTYRVNVAMAAVAAAGVLAATFYALRLVQQAFPGAEHAQLAIAGFGDSRRAHAGRDDRFAALAGPLPAARVPYVRASRKPIPGSLEMIHDCH